MSKLGYLILILSILGGLGGIYAVGYTEGKANSESAQIKRENENYEALIDRLKNVQVRLDAQSAEFQEIKTLLAQKELGINKEVGNYVKTDSASVHGLDAEWVRVYNASLPSTTNIESTSRPDDKAGTTRTDATQSTKR